MKKSFFSLIVLLSGSLLKAEKNNECIGMGSDCVNNSMVEMCVSNSPTKNECQDNCEIACDITCDLTSDQTNQMKNMNCATSNMNPTEMDSTQMCMMQAVTTNDMDLVQKMVNAGVDVNCCDENGKTPLMCAVDMGHLNMYQYLISQGADVFMRDKAGNSVLFYACSKTRSCDMEIDHQKICDHQEIILSLLESGIDF